MKNLLGVKRFRAHSEICIQKKIQKIKNIFQVSNDPELSHEERESLVSMLSSEMTSSQQRLGQALMPLRPAPDGKPQMTTASSPRSAGGQQGDASVLLEQYSNMLVNMIQNKMNQG